MRPVSGVAKIVLSFFALMQVFLMVVLANGTSYPGRNLPAPLLNYANSISLNTPWNFFSPDPAHTMYLRAVIRFEDSEGNWLQEPKEFYLPSDRTKIIVDSGERRFLYAMRYLVISPVQIEAVLIPYLCRQNPGASSVYVEHILQPIPNLDKAQFFTKYPEEDFESSSLWSRNQTQQAEGRCDREL